MKYSELVETYKALEATSKRLEKTYYIAKLIEKTKEEDLSMAALLLEGLVYPIWDERKVGVASRLVLKAINVATGINSQNIEKEWKKTGDLGIVTERLIGKKKQATLASYELSVKKVFDNLQKLANLQGLGSVDNKVKLIAELLTSAKPEEAKYITRTVLEDLRVGVGEGSIRDAIVWAYFPKIHGIFFKCHKCGDWMPNTEHCLSCKAEIDMKQKPPKECFSFSKIDKLDTMDFKKNPVLCPENDEVGRQAYNYFINVVQDSYNMTNDFGKVAAIAKTKGIKGLHEIKIELGKPIKAMLYQKAKDIKDAFENVGKPAAFEYKYDGFRMQIHKLDNKIILFTRSFEDVTEQFPDVVKYVKENVKADSVILDSEVVGIDKKTTRYLPFQSISQRIKRKYNINEMAKQFPVEVNVFDILYYNGKNMISEPFNKRRAVLGKIIEPAERKIVLSRIIVTGKEEEAEKFYHEALDRGNEGIMAKNLEAIYKPGSRVGFGMKIKPVMETLDLVIVGAEWGEGKRAKWLTSFTVACINDEGRYLEIGKVGTGIKELEGEGLTFSQLTDMLKPLIISEKGKYVHVKPKIVLEITYEEIQKSPTYSSGYALRFPRVNRLRIDRKPEDCSSLEQVEELYAGQK